MAEKSPFLMYKGRPLVRSGNTLYYGSMAEKYVIRKSPIVRIVRFVMCARIIKKWKNRYKTPSS